jgi:zinc/manganese transport system substrate-binding protein
MKLSKLVSLAAVALVAPSLLFAKLQVVTSTEDLAAIAREIGKDKIDVTAIAKGYQDPHFVDPKPSYLLKLGRADLLIIVGMELEVGWLPPLLQNARNTKILPGNPGYLDASEGCHILQKPTGTVDRSMGDVHPFGNPHYWTDPENGRAIARRISEKLSELDGAHAAEFAASLKQFEETLSAKERKWNAIAATFKGVKVITYHNSWPNFAQTYGLDIVNHVEPKPGIPPSPAHVQDLIKEIKRDKIPLLLIEPYFDEKLPQKIAEETGAKMLLFPPSVGGVKEIKTYFDLFDYDLSLLKKSLNP